MEGLSEKVPFEQRSLSGKFLGRIFQAKSMSAKSSWKQSTWLVGVEWRGRCVCSRNAPWEMRPYICVGEIRLRRPVEGPWLLSCVIQDRLWCFFFFFLRSEKIDFIFNRCALALMLEVPWYCGSQENADDNFDESGKGGSKVILNWWRINVRCERKGNCGWLFYRLDHKEVIASY